MRVLDYAASRQRPFKTTDAAAVFALSQRQTLRWLRAAESLGLVAWTGKFPTDRKAEWLPLVKIVPIPLMPAAHPSEEIGMTNRKATDFACYVIECLRRVDRLSVGHLHRGCRFLNAGDWDLAVRTIQQLRKSGFILSGEDGLLSINDGAATR